MDMAFDDNVFTIGGKLVTKLYNAGKFVLMQEAEHGEITTELDRAFINDLRDTVQRATNAFENFEFAHALQITETFFWDSFADNYIELVKRRARSETDVQGRASAVATLRLALNTLLRLFAPFVPTITDEIWSWTYAQETGYASIHQAPWPALAANDDMIKRHQLAPVPAPASDDSFDTACRAIAAVRKAKHEAKIGLGKPLATLEVSGAERLIEQLRIVSPDVADAGGATEIEYQIDKSDDGYTAEVVALPQQ